MDDVSFEFARGSRAARVTDRGFVTCDPFPFLRAQKPGRIRQSGNRIHEDRLSSRIARRSHTRA
jgi:hypothetical protein